jgi:serine/threonine protein kinase
VAKVADFGYSSWFANDNELVIMPKSQYWTAPEWHHRGFAIADAMKMDIYSFGILCLWLLFYNAQEDMTCDFDNNPNSAKSVLDLAHQSIRAIAGLDDQRERNLTRLFDLTLANNPAERSSDFNQLIHLFASHR